MKHLLATAAILLATQLCLAQDHRLSPTNQAPATIIFQGQPSTIQTAPAPVVVAPDCKMTVCVIEPKKNTKTVYTSVCKEYCVLNCSLFGHCSLFGSSCGSCGDCGTGCGDCEKRTRNILVKKKAPACDTTQCVLKEVGSAGK